MRWCVCFQRNNSDKTGQVGRMFSQLPAMLGSSPADGMIAARSPLGTSAYPAGSSVTGCRKNESYLNRVDSLRRRHGFAQCECFFGIGSDYANLRPLGLLGATTYQLIYLQAGALFFPCRFQ
jgi:hypothetical protein